MARAPSSSASASGAGAQSSAEGAVELPEEFKCPISQEIMRDPVMTADGHTFDRANIERWLQRHSTSPSTNLKLPSKALVPNHALRSQMQRMGLQLEPVRTASTQGRKRPRREEDREEEEEGSGLYTSGDDANTDEGEEETGEDDEEDEYDEDGEDLLDAEDTAALEQLLCELVSSDDEDVFVRPRRRSRPARGRAKGKAKAKAKAKVACKAKAKSRPAARTRVRRR